MSSFNPVTNAEAVQPFNTNAAARTSNIATEGLVGNDPNNPTNQLFNNLTDQAANLHGLQILYYRHDFKPKESHPIYGSSNDPFLNPVELVALIDIPTDTSLLTSLGIETNSDVSLEISYTEFARAFGPTVSPQNGDKFEIKDLLSGRPSGFTKIIFEVTVQGDGDLFQVYNRWQINGARSDFNFKDNEPQEIDDTDVFDSDYAGPVDLVTHEPIPNDPQGQFNAQDRDIDDIAAKDLREDDESTGVYGGYHRRLDFDD